MVVNKLKVLFLAVLMLVGVSALSFAWTLDQGVGFKAAPQVMQGNAVADDNITDDNVTQPQPLPTEPTPKELTGDEIANAPVIVGSVATGGKEMQLAVNFPPYEDAVDIYVGIMTPDGTLYLVNSNKELTPSSDGLVAFATNTTDAISETIFSFSVCNPFGLSIQEGTYNVYSVVVPAGTDISSMDWSSDPYILTYYSFEVNEGNCE